MKKNKDMKQDEEKMQRTLSATYLPVLALAVSHSHDCPSYALPLDSTQRPSKGLLIMVKQQGESNRRIEGVSGVNCFRHVSGREARKKIKSNEKKLTIETFRRRQHRQWMGE